MAENIVQNKQIKHTEGIKTLLGDPKRAIIKLAMPMIIAMFVQTLYNFADALWVSFLGPDALSAVGFFFPFFFMIMSVGSGIGMGGSAPQYPDLLVPIRKKKPIMLPHILLY